MPFPKRDKSITVFPCLFAVNKCLLLTESEFTVPELFEENNLEIISSGFERIPKTTTKLSEEQQADVEKLLERLEEDDDVQNVYHSMEM